jgi:hypothetical protein
VLRGSPPSTAKSVPSCPPGYTVGPDYGCVTPSVGDYSSGWPGYDYWPDWGWGGGWGYGRFPSSRGSHGFARFHGFRHFGHFPGGVSAPSRARLKNHRDPIRSHRNGDMSPARQSVRLPSRRVRRRQRSVTT